MTFTQEMASAIPVLWLLVALPFVLIDAWHEILYAPDEASPNDLYAPWEQ
jgi:hypothetical protein